MIGHWCVFHRSRDRSLSAIASRDSACAPQSCDSGPHRLSASGALICTTGSVKESAERISLVSGLRTDSATCMAVQSLEQYLISYAPCLLLFDDWSNCEYRFAGLSEYTDLSHSPLLGQAVCGTGCAAIAKKTGMWYQCCEAHSLLPLLLFCCGPIYCGGRKWPYGEEVQVDRGSCRVPFRIVHSHRFASLWRHRWHCSCLIFGQSLD